MKTIGCEAAWISVREAVAFTGFDSREPNEARERSEGYAELGIRHLVAGARYADASEFRRHLDFLAEALALSAA